MPIPIDSLIVLLLVGLAAGWLAGVIMQGSGFGIIGNMIVGVIGAVIGFYLMRALHVSIASGLAGQIITATIGSVVLLFILGQVRR